MLEYTNMLEAAEQELVDREEDSTWNVWKTK